MAQTPITLAIDASPFQTTTTSIALTGAPAVTWSEILHILGPALSCAAAVAVFVTWLYRRHVVGLEKHRRRLAQQLKTVTKERDDFQTRFDRVQPDLEKVPQYRATVRDLKERVEELTEVQETFDAIKAKLQKRTEAAETEAARQRGVVQQWQQYKLHIDNERQALQHSTAGDAARIQQLAHDLEECEKTIAGLESNSEQLREQRHLLEANLADANTALEQLKKERFELKEQLTQLEAQLEGALEQTGRVWEKPLAKDAPPFVPLAMRKTPIISLINLKGGVGKTTLTANLGAILGLHGKRVLLIDLDYQRSLSLMCCSHDQIKQLHISGRCVQHFLLHNTPDAAKLTTCLFPVKTADGCEIVAVSEAREGADAAATLEDAEMRLMARWLLGQGPDVRTHLRRALHSPAIHERFDYVLLDCPPRFSTACINALAASDFALVPILLDRTSAISAPNLLRKLKRLRDCHVLGGLDVLGVVANGVKHYRDALTKTQAQVWDEIRVPCHVAWGEEVHFFDAKIKHSAAVAEAAERQEHKETTGTFAAFQDDLKPLFTDLVEELHERIAHERSRLATVSA
jgi:cellulose biosynthesis protein BcsQ/predicted  nucleic acid-binding Zn-ribbon protein